ncbi:MAG: ATP-binding cassette domain-containing protein [Epulopiscium sp.]|nr:ATP-binding cassette domain-containing protein [Candidatus Epulonipiscium sp.]
MIEARKVYLEYPDGTKALNNIELRIRKGEVVYIIGPSGSGKTSLLKLLMGIEQPTLGELVVLGRQIQKGSKKSIREIRRQIGPVFQEFKLIQGRTAMENVIMAMRVLGMPKGLLNKNALDSLEKVGLTHKAFQKVEHLSWGERQRVAIARAVARKPALIIADEPTGNLDIKNALNIMDLLRSFKDEETTVIITTHATHLIEDIKEGTLFKVNSGHIVRESMGGMHHEKHYL